MQLDPAMREVLTWHPHVDVWVTVLLLAGGYLYAIRRIGPFKVGEGQEVVTRRQVWQWYIGVAALWFVSDWPFHDLAEESMFAAHMVEHMVIAFVTAPLLLLGTPKWLAQMLVVETGALPFVRWVSKPVPAFALFNFVFIGLHWPVIVTGMVTNSFAHFAVHLAMFLTGLAMWMPIISPLPEVRRISRPMQMLYLMAHSIIPIVPASFLTFGQSVIYPIYDTFPRLFEWSAIEDQTIAGVIMKLVGGFTLWGIIAAIWFKWTDEQAEWDAIERRLRADDEVRGGA